MNIQINCKDNVEESDLRIIYYNLKDVLKDYEETKNDYYSRKIINGKYTWYRHLSGSFLVKSNIDVTCNGKTMFFKIDRR